jgi:hypothetical protein
LRIIFWLVVCNVARVLRDAIFVVAFPSDAAASWMVELAVAIAFG